VLFLILNGGLLVPSPLRRGLARGLYYFVLGLVGRVSLGCYASQTLLTISAQCSISGYSRSAAQPPP
jgi:hypothetical protein